MVDDVSLIFDPSRDCDFCPRLKNFIEDQRRKEPDWHNAPVATWSDDMQSDVRLLIVGLAPGLRGANRTGRPFTGDFAGDLLYGTLCKFGFAKGNYSGNTNDTLKLQKCAITNAVRCVPPQNKPVGSEINTCRQFLSSTISRFKNLQAVVTLGSISHQSTIKALGLQIKEAPFRHGGQFSYFDNGNRLNVFSSYHCSRYNTNTGRLTQKMFEDIFKSVAKHLENCK